MPKNEHEGGLAMKGFQIVFADQDMLIIFKGVM